MAGSGINKLVDGGERIIIFRCSPIEVSVIDADPPLSVGFLDKNNICNPLGKLDFVNEVCL